MGRVRRLSTGVVGLLLVTACAAAAQDDVGTTPQPGTTFTARTSVKASALVFQPAETVPGAIPPSGGESVWRVRFEPQIAVGEHVFFDVAYEHRFRFGTGSVAAAVVGILPPNVVVPYRVTPLTWFISTTADSSWRHEIDRASMRVSTSRTEVTIGRQAIGWGRGVLFTAVDLFAPFQPLEADREWRPGVDAVRADVKVTDRASIDLVAAGAKAWDGSVLAARARGYAGRIDLEVLGGRRARDLFVGATSSAAVGDAEVHGELAAFHVPSTPAVPGPIVWKAVAGASYQFPVGAGLLTYFEYHYSGFGATNPAAILRLLVTPDFAERYVRGDMQILSRHALGVSASYERSPLTSFSGQWVHNPVDGSGILSPAVTLTFSNQLSLFGSVYIPYGHRLTGGVLGSEYGAVPFTGFAQLRLYL